MTATDTEITNHKGVTDNSAVIDAAKALLSAAGFNTGDVDVALDAIKTAKEQPIIKQKGDKVFWLDKTLVYEDNDAFIYRRATSKSGVWYLRIYDDRGNKPVVRSLKTTDKVKALTTARVMYIDLKGKIDRGEKLKKINSRELIERYKKSLEEKISVIPMTGITPDHYKVKKYHLRLYTEFLMELGLLDKPIDKIDPLSVTHFGLWIRQRPKQTCKHKEGRSPEVINDTINEVIRMYHQVAVKYRYLDEGLIPKFDKVRQPVDEAFKRDVLTEDQYERFWKYLQHKYISKKHNPSQTISRKGMDELEKRKIFKEFILLIAGVGFRTKELLGIKMSEIIFDAPSLSEEDKKYNVVMVVRRENAKTGRSRRVIAPVRKRIERIIAAYKKLGITHEPDDFLFINAAYGRRTALGRMIMYNRLKATLIGSGVQEELDKEGKSLSPYSFRHFYCYLRLINKVPIHLLAKNMGTSIQKIESTYGHIITELHANVITAGQGIIKRTETSLQTLPTIEEEI